MSFCVLLCPSVLAVGTVTVLSIIIVDSCIIKPHCQHQKTNLLCWLILCHLSNSHGIFMSNLLFFPLYIIVFVFCCLLQVHACSMEAIIREQLLSTLTKFDSNRDTIHLINKNVGFDQFIEEQLQKLGHNLHTHPHHGHDSRHLKETKYLQFKCVRSGHKRSESSQKAVRCPAYVSFHVYTYVSHYAIVERRRLEHVGHDPRSKEDKRYHSMDPELESLVRDHLKLGVNTDIILTLTYRWAQSQGHTYTQDRQYYLTPSDVQEIRRKVS